MYVQFYGYNVGVPVAEGKPVTRVMSGWKTITCAGEFPPPRPPPFLASRRALDILRIGWLGQIHEALGELEP